jgi:hypothetical protein
MRRTVCTAALLVVTRLVAASLDIELPVAKELLLPAVPDRYFQVGDRVVIDTGGMPRALILNLTTLDVEAFPVEPLTSVFGVDRRGVVADQYVSEAESSGHREVFFYDVRGGKRMELSKGVRSLQSTSHIYFQNGQSFDRVVHAESNQELSVFDLRTGEEQGLGWRPGVSSSHFYLPHAISRDKQNLVVLDYQGATLYQPATGSFGPTFGDIARGGAVFVTNSIMLFLSNGRYVLRSVAGSAIADLSFGLRPGWSVEMWFSDDLRYGMLRGPHRPDGVETVIVDATPIRDWLDSQGLWFHTTTGVVNAQEVRVRENANLQAYVFGTVSAGDEVAVLDRSGIKEKIGGAEDWWYKVRRERDRLEGWMYGAFLDLAKE